MPQELRTFVWGGGRNLTKEKIINYNIVQKKYIKTAEPKIKSHQ